MNIPPISLGFGGVVKEKRGRGEERRSWESRLTDKGREITEAEW